MAPTSPPSPVVLVAALAGESGSSQNGYVKSTRYIFGFLISVACLLIFLSGFAVGTRRAWRRGMLTFGDEDDAQDGEDHDERIPVMWGDIWIVKDGQQGNGVGDVWQTIQPLSATAIPHSSGNPTSLSQHSTSTFSPSTAWPMRANTDSTDPSPAQTGTASHNDTTEALMVQLSIVILTPQRRSEHNIETAPRAATTMSVMDCHMGIMEASVVSV